MKVVAKREYDAVKFDGTGEGLLEVLATFPDAYFRIEMDEGTINLSIRIVPNSSDHYATDPGDYIVFEGDRYNVYDEKEFFQRYTYDGPKNAKGVYDPVSWGEPEGPYDKENTGANGTTWYDQPLFVETNLNLRGRANRLTPPIPTEEQF
jgi:hypothetical protein